MIGISKLYCGTVEPSDPLRYRRRSADLPSSLLQFSLDKRPVVVWNVTGRCNLHCRHCYSGSRNRPYPDELSTDEAKAMLRDLADFGSPVVLFSGGEPLMRPDLLELIAAARQLGMRAVLSTNATLLDAAAARRLADVGLSYIGISLDGPRDIHDRFRGASGSFDAAMAGLEHAETAGIKVGLRCTISRGNAAEIPELFRLVEERRIPRICFYHLVYSGRGSSLREEDLSLTETRRTVDQIIDLTADLHRRGHPAEVLTVDNHADGVHLYRRLLQEDPQRAAAVYELLRMNGGNSSGVGIASVGWDGEIYADQFWRHRSFGNVRERPFSSVWTDLSDPLMKKLKEKRLHVKGRCARCRYLEVCGGNFRVRAEAVTGDTWAADPACYLSDTEIGISGGERYSPHEQQREQEGGRDAVS